MGEVHTVDGEGGGKGARRRLPIWTELTLRRDGQFLVCEDQSACDGFHAMQPCYCSHRRRVQQAEISDREDVYHQLCRYGWCVEINVLALL